MELHIMQCLQIIHLFDYYNIFHPCLYIHTLIDYKIGSFEFHFLKLTFLKYLFNIYNP